MSNLARPFRTSLLLLAGLPAVLVAQSNTTAALTGTVRDNSGKPLAGATVRIVSEALIGGARTALTGANGSYRFPALPPGLYAVEFQIAGLPMRKTVELLELGQTTTSNMKLVPEASATVEVIGDAASAQSTEAAGVATNFTAEALDKVPTGRDLTMVAALTPGITTSDPSSGADVRAWGSDGSGNAFTIDGLNVGDSKAGQKWVYADPDWFSQVQVMGLGAPAEFGNFSGAVINGVVKSGGNAFSGSLSMYAMNSSWAARSSNTQLTDAQRVLPDGTYREYSFNVGGPIQKDKLWYFVAITSLKDSVGDPVVGAKVPIEQTTPRFLGKLTWQVTPTPTWEAFLEYDKVDREHRGITQYISPEATYYQRSPSRLFTSKWTQTLGLTKVLTLQLSSLNARDDRYSYHPDAYPVRSNLELPDTYRDPAGNAHPELTGYSYWGSYYGQLRQNFRGRLGFSATMDMFYSGVFSAADNHAIRLGLEVEQSKTDEARQNASPNDALYRVRYEQRGSIPGYRLTPREVRTGGGRDVKASMDRSVFFIQDTWTLNPNLSIRPGVRFEQFKGKGNTGPTLWDTTTVAPRLGLTWNVTQDQKHVVKAHLGRYFSGLSSDYFATAIPGAYRPTNVFYWGSRNSDTVDPYRPNLIPFDPDVNGDDFNYTGINWISTVDPKVRQPYTDEVTLSYEHRLNRTWGISATGVYRAYRDILVRTDPTYKESYSAPIYNLVTGGTMRASFIDASSDHYLTHKYLITNGADARHYYKQFTLAVDRAFENHWSMNASYSWALNEGNYASTNLLYDTFADPNLMINSRGKLPNYNDREARLRLNYEAPWAWKTEVGLSFTYLSGERYTPFISLIYGQGDDSFSLQQLAEGINATPQGSEKYPSRHLLDLKLTQSLPFSRRIRAEVFVDVFNLLNTGTPYLYTTSASFSELVDINAGDDATGLRTVSPNYRRPDNVDVQRRFRVGFKLRF